MLDTRDQLVKTAKTSFLPGRIYEYSVSFLFALIIFITFSLYIYLRRGFYDLYIANKVFAGTAAVQLGVVLLLGPLSRMFNIFDRYLHLRNELGIVVFFLAVTHSLTSLFFLPDHFSLIQYFIPFNLSFIFGLTGILIITFLFFISNKKSRDLLTVKKWWPIQYWGVRIGFIVIALHVFVLKYEGWVEWYLKGGAKNLRHPEWPGLGLLVGWFFLFVIIIRVAERINIKMGKLIAWLSFFLLIFIYIFTFVRGYQLVFK